MELSGQLITIISLSVALATVVIYFGLKLKRQKEAKPKKTTLEYEKARQLCRKLMQDRYQGQRGFVKPYVQEFAFDRSTETLRKVLQQTNPVPNRYYIQHILDDLAPGKYKVLAPLNEKDQKGAA